MPASCIAAAAAAVALTPLSDTRHTQQQAASTPSKQQQQQQQQPPTSGSIQQSLTALGGVLKRVARGHDVPASARASPLTWLGKATMRQGQSRTYLLLCLGPAAHEHQDAVHTLKYAASVLRPGVASSLSLGGGGGSGNDAASVVSRFTMGGGGGGGGVGAAPGTPVREEDVQDWSLLTGEWVGE